MGILDKLKDLAGSHEKQVDQGLDKAADIADEKTGGKHSEQIDRGRDKVGDYLNEDKDKNG